MRNGTKGAGLARRIDAASPVLPVDPTWDADRDRFPSYGFRRPVTARQIDAMADAEYERMTSDGWDNLVCSDCRQVMSDNGACGCWDGPRDHTAQILASLGLTPPPA